MLPNRETIEFSPFALLFEIKTRFIHPKLSYKRFFKSGIFDQTGDRFVFGPDLDFDLVLLRRQLLEPTQI